VRFPIIHLNGTGHQELLAQAEKTRRAIGAAMEALIEMAPNGRDYYPDPDPRAFEEARAEWNDRCQRLSKLGSEICEIEGEIARHGRRH